MTITIDRAAILEYQPLTRKGRAKSSNFLVRMSSDVSGREVIGVGECQATNGTTDGGTTFLERAFDVLRPTSFDDNATDIAEIRRVLKEVDRLAAEWSGTADRASYLGMMLSIEMALLDFVARAHDKSLADLLGSRRSHIEVARPAISLRRNREDVETRYRRQRRVTNTVRFQLTGDVAADLRVLDQLADLGLTSEWWLKLPHGLPAKQAGELVGRLVTSMRRGKFPQRIILEQPVESPNVTEMAALQRQADRLATSRGGPNVDLRIMADLGAVTADGIDDLTSDGGCRAINITIAQAGGILASLDRAQAAVEHNPDVVVALSGAEGMSDISRRALQHVGMALPRLDYFTLPPQPRESIDVTGSPLAFIPNSRTLEPPSGHGLGVEPRYGALVAHAKRYRRLPAAESPMFNGRHANHYPDEGYTNVLQRTRGLRSHLVEREALAHGLATTRYSSKVFVARGDRGRPLVFGSSARAPVSGACSFVISDKHKGTTHALLSRAGAPRPVAQIFAPSDLAGATEFARRIGFPVVTKPASGTGGVGVSTNLLNDEQVAAAFEAIKATRFGGDDVLVERHVPGSIHRIFVTDREVIAAFVRHPPFVVGDGVRSIGEMVIEKNALRAANPVLRKGLIDAEQTLRFLTKHGRDLDSVPALDEHVFLADKAYLGDGGEPIDVLDDLHPSIKSALIRAVNAVPELRFCGVDILLEDHRLPLDAQAAGICEFNACPLLTTPQFPLFGTPRMVSRHLLVAAANQHEVTLPAEPASQLSVRVSVTGHDLGNVYAHWLTERAQDFNLVGALVSVRPDHVEAIVSGALVPVSVLVTSAISGPSGTYPLAVSTRHVQTPQVDEFTTMEEVSYASVA